MTRDFDAAVAWLELIGAQLGDARGRELALEDQRAILKVEAIRRILAAGGIDGHEAKSVTAAEKLVELDPEYANIRSMQRDAVVAVDARRGQFYAAKLRAEYIIATLAEAVTP